MKKKTVLILLSLLHICVFCIGILIILRDRTPRQTSLVSDTLIEVTAPESETLIEVPLTEESAAKETAAEETAASESLPEEPSAELPSAEDPAPLPSYTFEYVRGKRNLNIRNAPSMQARIIGKIPPGKGGIILEFADEDWALIEYRGTTGYSSLHWMKLIPVSADETSETVEDQTE